MTSFKNPSFLIKNSGELSAPRRGELSAPRDLQRIQEIVSLSASVWIKKPAAISMDPRLSLADKAIWESVALIEFLFGECAESLGVIGGMIGVSKRQTVDSVNRLIDMGRLTRKRSVMRNRPDSLSTASAENQQDGASTQRRSLDKCSLCNRYIPVDAVGVCVVCRQQARAEQETDRALNELGRDASLTVVWAHLKAHGSKSGQKAIERAYRKLTELAA